LKLAVPTGSCDIAVTLLAMLEHACIVARATTSTESLFEVAGRVDSGGRVGVARSVISIPRLDPPVALSNEMPFASVKKLFSTK
jgi:hypothetical protein